MPQYNYTQTGSEPITYKSDWKEPPISPEELVILLTDALTKLDSIVKEVYGEDHNLFMGANGYWEIATQHMTVSNGEGIEELTDQLDYLIKNKENERT